MSRRDGSMTALEKGLGNRGDGADATCFVDGRSREILWHLVSLDTLLRNRKDLEHRHRSRVDRPQMHQPSAPRYVSGAPSDDENGLKSLGPDSLVFFPCSTLRAALT
eukprot:scaffold407_cov251-Pinguiococcus_pyrenoidosus.AAC.49